MTELDEAGEFLMRELQRLRVTTRYSPPSDAALPADADVIYCDYDPHLPRKISWPLGSGGVSLVIILPQTGVISADALLAATPRAVLARPFTQNAIVASLIVARLQSATEENLCNQAERIEDTLRSVRTIERAKTMMMSARGLNSDEAYKFIRTLAMERRTTVSSLAATIVSSFELFGD